MTISKLFERFNKICKTYASEMDSEAEFQNLCTMVQDNGLVEIKKVKDSRNSKVNLIYKSKMLIIELNIF